MTSVSNSFIGLSTNSTTTGGWENVTIYSTVCVNISVPAGAGDAFSAQVRADWALSELPTPVSMGADVITGGAITVQPGTSRLLQIPVKADLFRLIVVYNPANSVIPAGTIISTMYKDTTSHVILEDRQSDDAMLNAPTDPANATCLKTILTDNSGNYISTTDLDLERYNALYMHPDLSMNNSTLIVSVPVGSRYESKYEYVDKTNAQTLSVSGGHTMLTSLTSSTGIAPAVTTGGGFYYALADVCGYMITTTNTRHLRGRNAVNVSLSDASGYDISGNRPLWIEFTNAPPLSNGEFTVLLPGTGAKNLVTTVDLSNHHIGLRTLGISNLNDTVMWVKVYDISSGVIDTITEEQLSGRVKLNIPVPAYQSRDLNMGKGVNFTDGVYFRMTSDYPYRAEPTSPQLNGNVVVTGSYRLMN